jgi:hypothetical protein
MSNEKELLQKLMVLAVDYATDKHSHCREVLFNALEAEIGKLSKPDTISSNNEKVNISLLEENERLRRRCEELENSLRGSVI